jgi:hypothetical protein
LSRRRLSCYQTSEQHHQGDRGNQSPPQVASPEPLDLPKSQPASEVSLDLFTQFLGLAVNLKWRRPQAARPRSAFRRVSSLRCGPRIRRQIGTSTCRLARGGRRPSSGSQSDGAGR